MVPFVIHPPTAPAVPVILSVPHCGTAFPDELKAAFRPELAAHPDDTDWFVDKLYDFAPAMGITLISAVYSRWVIDLNRDPESKPLYTDGRIITALCPATTFTGEPLYTDARREVEAADVAQRLTKYYWPYHHKLQELIQQTRQTFGKVLLWDCHSIRQYVPTINKDKFPDLILGDADETSASPEIIATAYSNLGSGSYSLQHNFPFKGGYITRKYGIPQENQQTLQLEMSKVNYMDDAEQQYHTARADKMRGVLKTTLSALIDKLTRQ